nr:hypothetical protein [Bacteroidota bacterium]
MQSHRQKKFYDRCELVGISADKNYYWYHTVDLGNGLITPGVFDFRKNINDYCFPENLQGQTVLDVGSATGFFSFEFAKRGAEVTASELPSLFELDIFPGQNISDLLVKAEKYASIYMYQKPNNFSVELLYRKMLYEPFEFCSQILGLSIRRKFATIYDLSAEALGQDSFDWVFIGDVLL